MALCKFSIVINHKELFARKLKTLRINNRWSQEYCASHCRVNISTWKRWESTGSTTMPSDMNKPPIISLFPMINSEL